LRFVRLSSARTKPLRFDMLASRMSAIPRHSRAVRADAGGPKTPPPLWGYWGASVRFPFLGGGRGRNRRLPATFTAWPSITRWHFHRDLPPAVTSPCTAAPGAVDGATVNSGKE
jgi:hypothetical protein